MKKNPHKKIFKIILSIFFIGIFFNFCHTASADVVAQQLINSGVETYDPYAYSPVIELGTGLSGRALDIKYYASSSYSGQGVQAIIYCFTNSTYTTQCPLVAGVSGNVAIGTLNNTTTEKALYTSNIYYVDTGSTSIDYLDFSPDNYYILKLQKDYNYQPISFYGLSGPSNETCFNQMGFPPTSACTTLQSPYFELTNTATPPATPTCSDGIMNGDETAIDAGGSCFYVSLNWPENASTVPDFAQWTVEYYGNDTTHDTELSSSPTMQKGVMWSDDATLLNTCKNFPSDTATYSTCFGGTTMIHIDYGNAVYTSLKDFRSYIDKTGTMQAGKQYYARAVLYSINDTTLARETMLSYSDVISFRVDNSIGTGGSAGACAWNDFGCIGTAVLKAVFVPKQTSFLQFQDFKNLLTQKAPFGYAVQIYDDLTTIHYDASDPVIVMEQVTPITNLIFTPMRTGLAWVLWFAFAFLLFKRFKDIQI